MFIFINAFLIRTASGLRSLLHSLAGQVAGDLATRRAPPPASNNTFRCTAADGE
jgi:hypothetical protein